TTPDSTPGRVPDAAAVAEAIKELQSQRATELAAAKKPEQKLAVARTLRDEAQQAGKNPARQAALWMESAELLKNAIFPANQRTENVAFIDVAAQLLDQTIAADQFDAAEILAKSAGLAYGRLKNVDMVNRMKDRQADVARMKAEYEKLGPALESLAASPGDP